MQGRACRDMSVSNPRKPGAQPSIKPGAQPSISLRAEGGKCDERGTIFRITRSAGLKWATSRAASTVATAVTPHLKNSDLVEAEKKNVSKDHELVKSSLRGI